MLSPLGCERLSVTTKPFVTNL